jgi:hypothetical protein
MAWTGCGPPDNSHRMEGPLKKVRTRKPSTRRKPNKAQMKRERQATAERVARQPTGEERRGCAPEATMKTLPVPFRLQKSEYSCAAASLEMAAARYKPNENTETLQEDIVKELSEPVPDGTDNAGIPGNKLIAKARQLGFRADGGRVSPDLDQMIEQVTRCITEYGMPLIAYQRLTNEEPLIGHCRVIFGVSENGVILHDPHPEGGPNLNWDWSKLRDFWLRTGKNVTGGVAVWVGDEDGPEPDSFLLPIEPNTWLPHTWPPGTVLPPDEEKATLKAGQAERG